MSEREQPGRKRVSVSVVIPACNERGSLGGTVERIVAALRGTDLEILVVDDGSTDGTWEEVARLAREHPVGGVRFGRNFGHQAALLAGLESARGAAVVTMDADGQHPPELLPQMVEKWRQGAVVVQALRQDDSEAGLFKRLTSKYFYGLFSWLAGTPIAAGSSDFRLLDRTGVEIVLSSRRSALFLRGFIPWTGLPTEQIFFTPRSRTSGESKYSPGRMLLLARQGIMRYSIKPLRVATLIGIATCLLSLSYLVYVVAVRLWGSNFVPGWASVTGLLALLGGVQLIVMGILGEYIGMIFEAQLNRPHFVPTERIEPAVKRGDSPTS
jgi:glycosyltransferase involved in cell wall biosynthesis